MTTTRAPASRSFASVGTEARIRPSSVILDPSRGTFRSERTSTVRPDTPSASEVVERLHSFEATSAVMSTSRFE